MRKNKKLLLASVAAMGALALGVGATSTFAWFKATANATAKSVQSSTLSSSTHSNIGDIDVNITITWKTPSGNPVQVDNQGHEWVYATDLAGKVDKDATFRTGDGAPDRFFTVGITSIAINATNAASNPNTQTAIDSAKGKHFKGTALVYSADTLAAESDRFVVHNAGTTLVNAVEGANYLIQETVEVTFSVDANGVCTVTSSDFRVVVSGGPVSNKTTGVMSDNADGSTAPIGYLAVKSFSEYTPEP